MLVSVYLSGTPNLFPPVPISLDLCLSQATALYLPLYQLLFLTKSLQTLRPKSCSFWLQERGEVCSSPRIENGEQAAKRNFSLLGSGQWAADLSGQPEARCPGNSPAPPLRIGCWDGRRPSFKGTPAIALLKKKKKKIYQSHCGWRNKWSFSLSGLFLPRGCWVSVLLGNTGG